MVGNDIIDLNETRRSTNWERPRFMDKVFTPKEQSLITNSIDPFTMVWHLWSMKESAYKVFIQCGGSPFFTPTKIECSLDCLKNGQVKIGALNLKTKTSINAQYIFSTATENSSELETSVFQLPENNNKQQSKFMYDQLFLEFSKRNSLDYNDLLIQKTKTGVPILHYRNKPINTSLSITHHGKYGAFSILNN